MRGFINDPAFQAAWHAGVAVLLLVGAVVLARRAWDILEPLLVAIVLATALWPWVNQLASARIGPRRWRAPRSVAAVLVFAVTVLGAATAISFALAALLPEVDRGLAAYPDQTAFLRDYLQPFRTGDIAGGAGKLAGEVARQATGAAQPDQPAAAQNAPVSIPSLSLALFGGVLQLGLVLIFTLFLLLQGHRFAEYSLRVVPWDQREYVRDLATRVRDRISKWVLAQIIYGSISGVVIWLTTAALQLPTPWLYGIIGATLGIFPGVGPWIAFIPAFVIALGMSVWQASAVAALGVAMYVIDSTILSTRIYGELLQLPMFVVLVALLIGAAMMGVWGAMIAAPAAAALQLILEDVLSAAPSGARLLTEPPEPPARLVDRAESLRR